MDKNEIVEGDGNRGLLGNDVEAHSMHGPVAPAEDDIDDVVGHSGKGFLKPVEDEGEDDTEGHHGVFI